MYGSSDRLGHLGESHGRITTPNDIISDVTQTERFHEDCRKRPTKHCYNVGNAPSKVLPLAYQYIIYTHSAGCRYLVIKLSDVITGQKAKKQIEWEFKQCPGNGLRNPPDDRSLPCYFAFRLEKLRTALLPPFTPTRKRGSCQSVFCLNGDDVVCVSCSGLSRHRPVTK